MFSEIRVLDRTDIAGQLTGKLLASLGMEVVKVEPPEGDAVRRMPPFAAAKGGHSLGLPFMWLNSGKKSVAIDTTVQPGADLVRELELAADVVLWSDVSSSRGPDRPAGSSTTWVRILPFGEDESASGIPFDDIVLSALGGITYISGDRELPPCTPPETQSFYLASVWAAFGVLSALFSGKGDDITVSIQAALASQDQLVRTWGFDGERIERHGSQHNRVAPSRVFATRDGYVHLYVSRVHWPRFLELWPDHPTELDDPELVSNEGRRRKTDLINLHVGRFIGAHETAEFEELMQKGGIPCQSVNAPSQVISDRHAQARDLFDLIEDPALGTFRQPAFPALFDGSRPRPARLAAPKVGEHTAQVLRDWLGDGHPAPMASATPTVHA
jgi:crotonobetainyl-CoA:carnitine CoA-transferase CaiB-like acyl-CoA transferase